MGFAEQVERQIREASLTFWVFVALRGEAFSVGEVRQRIGELTDGYQPTEQALYRLLRRLSSAELVDFITAPGNRGPNRKLYRLTKEGEKTLGELARRVVLPYYDPAVKGLLQANVRRFTD